MTVFGDEHQNVVKKCLKDMRRIAIYLEENDEYTSDDIRYAMRVFEDTEDQRTDALVKINILTIPDDEED